MAKFPGRQDDSAESIHNIAMDTVNGRCEIPGHKDLLVSCSCGFREQLNHGIREEAANVILHHRIKVLEEVAGIKFNIVY